MLQPEIEFLATDKFGFVQTGSRTLLNLSATSMGNGHTFQSNRTKSTLFGQALKTQQYGCVYLDVADDSLSFTGNNNTVTAFTVGAYLWGEGAAVLNDMTWTAIVPHGFSAAGDMYPQFTLWRMSLYCVSQNDFAYILTTNPAGTGTNIVSGNNLITGDVLKSGWFHLAFTYDPLENGGTIRAYYNGQLNVTRSNSKIYAFGANGACVAFYI